MFWMLQKSPEQCVASGEVASVQQCSSLLEEGGG
jgi:hypothetical protein